MKLRDEDVVEVEQRIQRWLKGLTKNDLLELINEAVSFLSETNITKVTPSVYRTLLKRLKTYRNSELLSFSREVHKSRRIEIRASDLRPMQGIKRTDEELLDLLRFSPRHNTGAAESEIYGQTEESRLREYQQAIARCKDILPAIEFEALQLMTGQITNPHLTYGLTRRGLKMYFRRARIRMKWNELIGPQSEVGN